MEHNTIPSLTLCVAVIIDLFPNHHNNHHRNTRHYRYLPSTEPHKENQDDLSITLKFAGEQGDAMFAVYDGHGTDGHVCAKYAKQRLPKSIAKHIRQRRVQRYQADLKAAGKSTKGSWDPSSWPMLDVEDYEACCLKSYIEVNKAMHDDDAVPDKLSGTTATAVSFHGGRMTVCNVGDSRVVVGHRLKRKPDEEEKVEIDNEEEEEKVEIDGGYGASHAYPMGMPSFAKKSGGELLALPLTRDQTPYRKDERERVRKLGAEIKSIDQMEDREPMHDNWGDLVLGKEVDIHGDPPRVWVKGNNYPGTAFTRSLGDRLAEDIGVIAKPEIITRELTANDEYLVVASDGVFEFLTNQQVIEMCDQCENPLQACELLVKAAYDKWLVHERRTDDITVIVLFLESKHRPKGDVTGTTADMVKNPNAMYGMDQAASSKLLTSEGRAGVRASAAASNDTSDDPLATESGIKPQSLDEIPETNPNVMSTSSIE
mmetsp:Transcript_22600/g.63050  ORF Transcript_22600/g.63050 Transcript_22600/m.63050 type:complete len:485 (-) Transcript_22600:22-1476(-)